MKPYIKKVIIISYLCSIQFYLAMQIVGQTEAAYTSQVSDPISISAAFVFPNTINQLEMAAKETSTKVTDLYSSIFTTSLDTPDSELPNQLVEVINKDRELKIQLMNLQKIHEELKSYHEQSEADPNSFDYVKSAYLSVDQIFHQVNETINLQQIEAFKSTIKYMGDETTKMQKNNMIKSQETESENIESLEENTNNPLSNSTNSW